MLVAGVLASAASMIVTTAVSAQPAPVVLSAIAVDHYFVRAEAPATFVFLAHVKDANTCSLAVLTNKNAVARLTPTKSCVNQGKFGSYDGYVDLNSNPSSNQRIIEFEVVVNGGQATGVFDVVQWGKVTAAPKPPHHPTAPLPPTTTVPGPTTSTTTGLVCNNPATCFYQPGPAPVVTTTVATTLAPTTTVEPTTEAPTTIPPVTTTTGPVCPPPFTPPICGPTTTVAPTTIPPTTVAPTTVPPTTVPPTTTPSTTPPTTVRCTASLPLRQDSDDDFFTLTVTGACGVPTGTVTWTFTLGTGSHTSTVVGTSSLNNSGVAVYPPTDPSSILTQKSHVTLVTVDYSGDSTYYPATMTYNTL